MLALGARTACLCPRNKEGHCVLITAILDAEGLAKLPLWSGGERRGNSCVVLRWKEKLEKHEENNRYDIYLDKEPCYRTSFWAKIRGKCF